MKKQITLTTILLLTLTFTLFSAAQTNIASADKADLEIVSYSYYVASSNTLATYAGDLVVVGEVQNVGTTNIGYAYVNAIAYVDDLEVAQASHQVYGNNIEPNQKVPFYLDFIPENSLTGDLTWVANVTNVIAYVGYVYNSDPSQYQDLTATSTSSSSSGTYTVTGKVTNTGAQTIGDVRVITTFYNSEGTVVNMNYTSVLSSSLTAGSSVSYTAQPVDNYPSTNIASHIVLVQSEIPEGTTSSGSSSSGATPTPTTTATATPTATATTTATPTNTTSQNTDDNTTLLIAVAAIIIAIIAIVVVLMLTKRNQKSLTPAPIQTTI